MLVVADASPVNVLVRIQHIDVLPRLFGRIIVPPAVERELSHPNTPKVIRDWLASPPTWLEVRAPTHVDASLPVDPGEREAISLARELEADILLVDDRKARGIAKSQGLRIAGTLSVLEQAAVRGFLDLRDALSRLRATDFSISHRLMKEALDRDDERREDGVKKE